MIHLVKSYIIPAAYELLPEKMASPEATAMLLAIGLQESRFEARRQVPVAHARGFWQFERGGVRGVLTHHSTKQHIVDVLKKLKYPAEEDIYIALPHNDILACVMARLLLWTLPHRMPTKDEAELGWKMYTDGWRPGKPHPEKWAGNFKKAWST